MIKKIPLEVVKVLKKIESFQFEAYIVGGCVRDLLLGKEPKDWDVTTSAKPSQLLEIFPDSFYENDFGTVGVKVEPIVKNCSLEPKRKHDIVEVTTFRIESTYSDRRRQMKLDLQRHSLRIWGVGILR